MRPDFREDIEMVCAYVERQAFKSLIAREDVVARIRDGARRLLLDWCLEIVSLTPHNNGYTVACMSLRIHPKEGLPPTTPAERAAAERLRWGTYFMTARALRHLLETYGEVAE